MLLTDREISIKTILSVTDGRIRGDHGGNKCRSSDAFIIVLSGNARYEFAEKNFSVGKGDVIFLPKGGCYSIAITEHPYTFIYTDFLFDLPEGQSMEADVYHTGLSLEHTFRKLLHLWRMGDFSDKLLCRALVYEIYAAAVKAAAMEELSTEHTDRLSAAVQHIHDHYTDPDLSVEQLAAMFGSSAVHFRRTFAKLYHCSPLKYITALRLSRARELLLGTDLPVGEISRRCGYTSSYYFDRVFKKEFGMQPLQLRKLSI